MKKIQKPRQKTNQPNKTTSEAHQSLSTQKAREAHTEKTKNLGPPSLPQQDNTVPLLLFYRNNHRQWHPQQLQQLPPLEQALQPLPSMHHLPLPLLQLPPQTLHPEEHHQGLTTDLGLLWLPLSEGLGQGPRVVEAEEEEAAEEGEEAAVEDNQLLSLHSSSSPSPQPLTCEPWERSPESSTEKETKPTHS